MASESGVSNPFDYSSYPRVTTLEQELLGRTYTTDSLPQRLSRMETKAFGAPSSSLDLGQRTDLLDDYAQRHDLYGEHKPSANPANAMAPAHRHSAEMSTYNRQPQVQARIRTLSAQNTYTSGNGNFIGSVEERVSMMEAQLFNHTYSRSSIDQRLKKLAKRILPNENIANLGVSEQTVKLWDTLHPEEKNQVASLPTADHQAVIPPVLQLRSSLLAT